MEIHPEIPTAIIIRRRRRRLHLTFSALLLILGGALVVVVLAVLFFLANVLISRGSVIKLLYNKKYFLKNIADPTNPNIMCINRYYTYLLQVVFVRRGKTYGHGDEIYF